MAARRQTARRRDMEATSARAGILSSSALTMSFASLACAVIVGFSALVRIPVPGTPVPVTLQTFALLGCAGMLGRWYSMQMVGWYLVLGLAGAPFFTGGGGTEHLFGATGGYLLGFVAAASIVGSFSSKCAGLWAKVALYLASTLAVYVPGIVWLKLSLASGWGAALSMGLFPFLLFDLVKASAAASANHIFRR